MYTAAPVTAPDCPSLSRLPRRPILARPSGGAAGPAADGAILSPMPGRIIAVEVAAGEAVAKGQKLVTLEAMKMDHTLTAPFDGTIADLAATRSEEHPSELTSLMRTSYAVSCLKKKNHIPS